jgi:mRNA-degrading endonuclease RelE of RelBE toxin-antitoxin system
MRAALRDLGALKGDIKDLQHPLEKYSRLRIHQFRVILEIHPDRVECLFIERRPIVCEVFEQTLLG